MKSIASTIYDYYLIRGIIDKKISNSKITQVKFMSPSNKLKLASINLSLKISFFPIYLFFPLKDDTQNANNLHQPFFYLLSLSIM